MSTDNIWEKYLQKRLLLKNTYLKFYKGIIKENNINVIIQQINKLEYKNLYQKDFSLEFLKENEIKKYVIETINSNDYYFVIYKYCEYKLETLLKIRGIPFTEKEIKKIMLKLNSKYKYLLDNRISIYNDFNISNLLLSFDDEYTEIKITGIKNIKENEEIVINQGKEINTFGEIIYLMLFMKKPFKNDEKTDEEKKIFKDNLNKITNDDLKKLLDWCTSENIIKNLNEYFNHPFFEPNKFDLCKEHSITPNEFCKNCNKNICKICRENHLSHELINFKDIGYTDFELNEIKNIIDEFEENIIKLQKCKTNMVNFYENVKSININKSVYENNINSNFKLYNLEKLYSLVKVNTNFLDEIIYFKQNDEKPIKESKDNNYIEATLTINEDFNQLIKLINENKDIKNCCEIYINDKNIGFNCNYKFNIPGTYNIKYKFSQKLKSTSDLFLDCQHLETIDLSKFDSSEIDSMKWMFCNCFSLKKINLSNFDTKRVSNMSLLFYSCKSLKTINLSSFNFYNTENFDFMFSDCVNLKEIIFPVDLNISNAIYLNGMFKNCKSLKNLDLSKFNTNNVEAMAYMFNGCDSLVNLDVSNFITQKVINMSYMFSQTSLPSLDLSSFLLPKNVVLNSIFKNCTQLNYLNISNFNTTNFDNPNEITKSIFKGINKKCFIEITDSFLNNKWNEYIKG